MRKSIKVSLLFGLSIILDYLTVFENNKEVDFDIQFSDELIKILRPEYDEKYYNLLKKYLTDGISKMENVKLYDGSDFDTITPNDLVSNIGVKPNSMELFDAISNKQIVIEYDRYIVINTKVITGKDKGVQSIWDSVKDKLFTLLNNYDYKVILIGEKNYSDCVEYRMHGVFSIYNDIIGGNLHNLVDLTIDDTILLYDDETIIRNLNYLSKSLFNIHIGEGGGIKIFAHMNNMVALTTSPVLLMDYVKSDRQILYSFDPETFLNNIKLYSDKYVF